MKGKYFLCIDEDGVMHSTNDYSTFILYRRMFIGDENDKHLPENHGKRKKSTRRNA